MEGKKESGAQVSESQTGEPVKKKRNPDAVAMDAAVVAAGVAVQRGESFTARIILRRKPEDSSGSES